MDSLASGSPLTILVNMGDCLSSGLPRRPGSTLSATHQLGVIDQVGEPPASAGRGPSVGATSGLLRSLALLDPLAGPTERRLSIHVLSSSRLCGSATPFSAQAGLRDNIPFLDGRVVEEWAFAPVFPPAFRSCLRPGVLRASSLARRVGPTHAGNVVRPADVGATPFARATSGSTPH